MHLAQIKKIQEKLKEKNWQVRTIILNSVCLLAVLLQGVSSPTKNVFPFFLSPLSQFQIADKSMKKQETFVYVPGWISKKLGIVNLSGVSTIAFFDVPALDDGTLVRDIDSYTNFKSEQANELFQRAHHNGVKVVLAVTMMNNTVIRQFLDNPTAKQTLINEIITEVKDSGIDGVNLDIEYKGDAGESYQQSLSAFVAQLTEQIRQHGSRYQVSVSLPESGQESDLYDVPTLAVNADRIFMMAYNVAVPEVQQTTLASPLFGFNETDYWQTIKAAIARLVQRIPEEKIVMETAWYGNGNKYPFYESGISERSEQTRSSLPNDLVMPLPKSTIERLVSGVPVESQTAARKNLPLIAKALQDEGILNANVLAYALATIEHETAGTFEPIDEIKGTRSARRYGYEGGTHYFGRGFIQLTHLRNYKRMGERIGLGEALVKDPALASDPRVAAKVLAAFFKDNGIASLAYAGAFVDARTPINPDYQGNWIASLAWKYLSKLG